MLNIHRIIRQTAVEGPGVRFAIWVQGCSHRCEGCFVPQTWSKDDNLIYSEEKIAELINGETEIEGITILGGEPFEQAEGVKLLLDLIDKRLSVIIFSGYLLSELRGKADKNVDAILARVDVLVDGRYIQSERDLSRPMVGSRNQKFYFFTDKYCLSDFPEDKIEVRIKKNGEILINGNGEISRLNIE